jgi:hypothetical protein
VRRAPGDRFGGDAALAVGGPGERQHRLLAGEHVRHLDGVADRPDRRIGSSHLRVDRDRAARPDLQPRGAREVGLGAHADGQDDEIGVEPRTALGHDRTARRVVLDPGADAPRVGNAAHGEDAGKIDAGQRRADRPRPGRQDECVVALLALALAAQIAHAHDAPRAVDGDGLGLGVHLDVETLAEEVARRHQQLLLVGDDVADVVRQAAVGERNVGTAIEDDDLHPLVEAAQARGARSAAGDAADDENAPLSRFRSWSDTFASVSPRARCDFRASARLRSAPRPRRLRSPALSPARHVGSRRRASAGRRTCRLVFGSRTATEFSALGRRGRFCPSPACTRSLRAGRARAGRRVLDVGFRVAQNTAV